MSPSLFFEGKKFISAKEASQLTGYSQDYVGQLSRLGKIESKRVGRIWYVSEQSLLNHKNSGGVSSMEIFPKEPSVVNISRSSEISNPAEISQISDEITTLPELVFPKRLPKFRLAIHEFLFSPGKGLIFKTLPLTMAIVLAVGAFSIKDKFLSLPQKTLHASTSLKGFVENLATRGVSEKVASSPAAVYRSLDSVVDLYANVLTDIYLSVGQTLIETTDQAYEEVKLVGKNPPLYIVGKLEILAVATKNVIDQSGSSTGTFISSAHKNTFSFISYSIDGIFESEEEYVHVETKKTENIKSLAAASASTDMNAFDETGSALYNAVNSFFDKYIYSPIARALNTTPSVSLIYLTRSEPTKTNPVAPTVTTTSSSPRPTTTIVNNTKVVEKIIETFRPSDATREYVDVELAKLSNKFASDMSLALSRMSTGNGGSVTNIYQQIAHSQKIDNIYNTNISNPTITNGTISGTTINSPATSIVVGNITNLTAGFSTTTNSTTTNAYASSLTADNATSTNFFSTNASSTNLFSTNGNIGSLIFGNATGTSATTTNLYSTTASSTNLFSTWGNIGTLNAGSGSFANLLLTGSSTLQNFTFVNATGTSATTTNFFSNVFRALTGTIDTFTSTLATIAGLNVGNSTTTNATTTNAFNTNLVTTNSTSTNSFVTNLSLTNLLGTYGTTTNATSTNFFSTNASSTNLFSTNGNIGSLIFGNATGTSATTTNLYSTNFSVGSGTLGSATISNLLFTRATGTSATTTNFFSTIGTFDDLYVNDYQQNNGTFSINSSVATGDIFSVADTAITSGTLIHQTLTANAGNGQVSKGQVIDLVDATVAGGGYTALSVNVTGSGVGSGSKTLLSLNPGGNNTVVFDSMGAFRPTADVSVNTNTVGSPSYYWKNGYFDTLTANNLSGTVVTGATSNDTWTIGSTETGDDLKALIFQRNSGSGNASLQWNSGLNDLRFLSVNYPFNATYTINDASIATTSSLYSGTLTNNTTVGTQTLLSLTNTGTGTTERGIFVNNTGTGTTGLEIAGTWTNGLLVNTGNVGIGTTSPYQKLSVAGNVIADTFIATSTTATSTFAGGLAVETSGFVYDYSTNNVGIGTASPSALLDISSSGSSVLKVSSAGLLTLKNGATIDDSISTPGWLYFTNQSAVVFKLAHTDSFLGIENSAANSIGWRFAAAPPTGGIYPSNSLTIVNTNGVRAMVIDPLGNIGLGSTTPGYKLSVAGSAYFDGGTVIASNLIATSSISAPSFTITGVAINSLLSTNSSGAIVATSTPTFGNFNATSTNATSTISGGLAIETSGFVYDYSTNFVGIGTASPGSSLHVVGSVTNGTLKVKTNQNQGNGNVAIFEAGNNTNALVIADTGALTSASTVTAASTGFFNRVGGSNSGNTQLQTSSGDALIQMWNNAGATVINQIHTNGNTYFNGGNIGIGTTTPSTLVEAVASSPTIKVTSTGGNGSYSTVALEGTSGNSGNRLLFKRGQAVGSIQDRWQFNVSESENATDNGDGSNLSIDYFVNGGSATSLMFFDRLTGRVGIGSSNPTQKLEVVGGAYFTGTTYTGGVANVRGSIANDSATYLTVSGGTSGYTYFSGNVGIGTTTPVSKLHLANTSGAVYQYFTNNSTGHTTSDGGVIGIDSSDNLLLGTYETKRIDFYTNGLATPDMVLDSSGNVGIGTTTPAQKFDVYGQASFGNTATRLTTYTDSNYSGIYNGTSLTSAESIYMGVGALFFYTGGQERMRIASGGNVGIGGTPGSAYKLDVYGRAVMIGDTEVSGGTRGDATTKWGQLVTPHYTNAEEPIHLISGYNNNGNNYINIGGGLTGNYNAATQIRFATAGDSVTTNGTLRWYIDSSGQFRGGADNTYDIGASGASRPRTIYVGTSLVTPSLTVSGAAINSLLSTNSSGAIVATSTPTFGNFNATSTNATSTISGGLAIETSGFVYDYSTNNVGIGTASPASPLSVVGGIQNEATSGSSAGRTTLTTISNSARLQMNNSLGNTTVQIHTAAESYLTGGSLGIGTTDPASRLSGTTGVSIYDTSTPGLSFSNSSTRNWLLYKSTDDFKIYNQSDGDLVTFKAGGNVGIGTTNPQAKLDILGTASSTLFYANAGSASAPSYSFATDPDSGIYSGGSASNQIYFGTGGAAQLFINTAYTTVKELRFGIGNEDVVLARDAANTLAQRNGTSAQKNSIYYTYTDASNYERVSIVPGTTNYITSENAGTGTFRPMALAGSMVNFDTGASGGSATVRWRITGDGHFITPTDNSYDIGASGATRPRTGYFGTSVVTPLLTATNFTTTNSTTTNATTTNLYFSNNLTGPGSYIVNSSGNVGIGTTNPGFKLDVVGGVGILKDNNTLWSQSVTNTTRNYITLVNGGGRTDLAVEGSAGSLITGSLPYSSILNTGTSTALQFGTNSIARMTIDTSGNVGIGTTTPYVAESNLSKLNIVTGTDTNVTISDLGGVGNSGISATAGCATYNTCLRISGANHSMLAIGGRGAATTAGNLVLYFDPTTSTSPAAIYTTSATSLNFGTNGSTNRMTLDTSGNLGIGTTSPATNLHVYSSANNEKLRLDTLDADGYSSQIGFASANTVRYTLGVNRTAGSRLFQLYGGTSPDYIITVNESKNVGIGTASPAEKLQIENGNILLSNPSADSPSTGNTSLGYIGARNRTGVNQLARIDFRTNDAYYHGAITFSTADDMLADGSPLTEKMRITHVGNVGIGTTSPLTRLSIQGRAGANDVLNVASSTGASMLYVNSAGNVGIGITSPSNKLHVVGTSNEIAAIVGTSGPYLTVGTGSNTGGFVRWNTDSNTIQIGPHATGGATVIGANGGNVGIGTTTPTHLLTVAGVARFGDLAGTNTGLFIRGANATTQYNFQIGTSITASSAFEIIPSTAVGGTTFSTPALVVAGATGNVGIGTANPATYKLEVNGGAQFGDGSQGYITASTDGHRLSFSRANISHINATNASGYLGFGTGGADQRMTIDVSGNVGIGITNPGSKLQITNTDTKVYSGTNSATWNIVQTINNTTNAVGSNALTAYYGGGGGNVNGVFGGVQNAASRADFIFASYNGSTFQENLRITDQGNVGIGTTGPGALLDVRSGVASGDFPIMVRGNIDNAGTGYTGIKFGYEGGVGVYEKAAIMVRGTSGFVQPEMHFLLDNTADSSNADISDAKLSILPGGNVGIGTTTPGAKLDLWNGDFYLSDSDVAHGMTAVAPTNTFFRIAPLSGTTGGTRIQSLRDANGQPLIISSIGTADPSDTLPMIALDAAKKSGTGVQALGALETVLQVQNNESNLLTVLGSGNVGIGTTTPINQLMVHGANKAINENSQVSISSSDAQAIDKGGSLDFTGKADVSVQFAILRGAKENATANNRDGYFSVATYRDGVGLSERMRVTASGNVGIGTTTPAFDLTVDGTIQFGNTSELTGGAVNIYNSARLGTYNSGGAPLSSYNFVQPATGKAFAIWNANSNIVAAFGQAGSDTNTNSYFSGNVGMGTTTPTFPLSLYGSGSVTQLIGSSNAGGALLILDGDSNGDGAGGDYAYLEHDANGSLNINNLKAASITLATNGSSPDVTLTSAGNLGIGTTTPDSPLHVNGGSAMTGSWNRTATLRATYPVLAFDSNQSKWAGIGYDYSTAMRFYVNSSSNDVMAGTMGMSILNSGNVGIGESTPGSKLSISGGATVGTGYDTTSAPTNSLLVEGNVGIGTTTPGALLDITSNSTTDKINISTYTTGATGATLRLKHGRGTAAASTIVSADDELGSFVFQGHDGTGFVNGANIRALVDGTPGVNDMPTRLEFQTTPDGSNGSAIRMTIKNNGNVGIGTSTPLARLSVNSTSESRVAMFRNSSAAWAAESNILLTTGDPDQGQGSIAWINRDEAATYPSQLQFRTISSNLEPTVKMVVTGAGNVGIGTTTPGTTLEINAGASGDTPDLLVNGGSRAALELRTATAGDSYSFFKLDQQAYDWEFGASNANGNFFINNALAQGWANAELTITNSGNVGIGTTGPGAKLEIKQAANSFGNGLRITNTVDNYWEIITGGTNNFVLGYGGSEKLNITSAGNVGIGTSTPWGLLSVNPNGLGSGVPEFVVGSSTATRLIVTGAGNVGIGTTNPGATLHVDATSGGVVRVSRVGTGAGVIQLEADGTNGTLTTTNATIFQAGGSERMRILSTGSVGIGTTTAPYIVYAQGIIAATDGSNNNLSIAGGTTPTIQAKNYYTDASLPIAFVTGVTENMRLTSSGSLGIGTTTPLGKLNVAGTDAQILITQTDASASNKIWGLAGTAEALILRAYNDSADSATQIMRVERTGTAIDSIDFFTAGTSRLSITSSGNVGIGTTDPSTSRLVVTQAADEVNLRLSGAGNTNGFDFQRITATGALSIQGNQTGANNILLAPTSGNVGIGTTTPGSVLEVRGAPAGNTSLLTLDSTSTNGSLVFKESAVARGYLGFGNDGHILTGALTDSLSLRSENALHFGTNGGNVRMTIDTSGYVGIGTTTPAAGLHLASGVFGPADTTGSAADQMFRINQSVTSSLTLDMGLGTVGSIYSWLQSRDTGNYATNYALALNPNGGNVGIGTTNPQTKLDVLGTASSTLLYVTDGTVGAPSLAFSAQSTTGFYRLGSGQVGVAGVLRTSDGSASSVAYGFANDAASGIFRPGASSLALSTAGTERIRIDSAGNVGIGTTTPYAKLAVTGTSGQTNPIFQVASSTETPIFTVGSPTGASATSNFFNVTGTLPASTSAQTTGARIDITSAGTSAQIQESLFVNLGAGFGGAAGAYGINVTNTASSSVTNIGSANIGNIGVNAVTSGVASGNNIGLRGSASNSTIRNIGVFGTTVGAAAGMNVGVAGVALNSTYNIGGFFALTSNGIPTTSSNPITAALVADNGSVAAPIFVARDNTTEVFRIDDGGNVGIGTTTPIGKLEVKNTVGDTLVLDQVSGGNIINFRTASVSKWIQYLNGNDFRFWDSTNGADRVTLQAGGNVGIGTTSPNKKLVIRSNSSSDFLRLETDGTHGVKPMISFDSGLSGVNRVDKAQIEGGYDSITSGTGGYLSFKTANSSEVLTDRLSINSSGNVGIGTTNPASSLHVRTGTVTTAIINGGTGLTITHSSNTIADATDAVFGGITIGRDKSTALAAGDSLGGINWGGVSAGELRNSFAAIGVLYGSSAESGELAFYTSNGSRNPDERMRIADDGNVGIGIAIPTSKMHVSADDATSYAMRIANLGNNSNREGLQIRAGANDASGTNVAIHFVDGDSTLQGSITFSGGTTSYNTTSDSRLKTNIQNTNYGLGDIMGIEVRDYTFLSDVTQTVRTGFIAQQLQTVFPDAVTIPNNPDQMWSVDYGKLTPLLVKGVQDLNTRTSGLSSATTTPSIYVSVQGNVGVGTSTPAAPFHVYSNSVSNGVATFTDANASCTIDPTTASLVCSSDGTLKKDIQTLNASSTLDKLLALRPVEYRWNGEDSSAGTHDGFIAQEVEAIFPEFVSTDANGKKAIAYTNFVPAMVSAIQALNEKVAGVDSRLTNLEALVASSTPAEGGISLNGLLAELEAQFDTIGAKFVNGIAYFKNIFTSELTVGSTEKPSGITLYDEETGDPYCLKIKNGAMVSAAGECTTATPSANPVAPARDPALDTSSPVITILGENPSVITVGSSYSDMGATVTDTNADGTVNDNLGLKFNVNGADVLQVSLDTTATSTNTIVYSAVDGSGNWGYATRTVEVIEQ